MDRLDKVIVGVMVAGFFILAGVWISTNDANWVAAIGAWFFGFGAWAITLAQKKVATANETLATEIRNYVIRKGGP